MKPGETTCPVASMTVATSVSGTAARSPIAAIRSPMTPTSDILAGAPLPSISSPPRSTRSNAIGFDRTGNGPARERRRLIDALYTRVIVPAEP